MLNLGILILRLAIGLTIAAHGTQKLFGWFGGPGMQGTTGWLASLGLRPASLWAALASLTEVGGGVLLALGLANPLGPLGVSAAMLIAIILAHWPRFFATNHGMEYALLLLMGSVAAALLGSGTYSLDALLGLTFPEPITLIGGGLAVIVGTIVALATRATPQAAPAAQHS